jgi:hypothetical protein
VAIHLSGLPGEPSLSEGGRAAHSHAWPCSGWGLPSHRGHPRCWCALTAPFHPYLCGPGGPPSAVSFLWHCPAGHPDWPLASTLLCGVPTFLDTIPHAVRAAATRPTHRRLQSAIAQPSPSTSVRSVPPLASRPASFWARARQSRPCVPIRRWSDAQRGRRARRPALAIPRPRMVLARGLRACQPHGRPAR